MIIWQEADKDTIYHPGMVIKCADARIYLVGHLTSDNDNTCKDSGCGCCSNIYDICAKHPNWKITHYANIFDMGVRKDIYSLILFKSLIIDMEGLK